MTTLWTSRNKAVNNPTESNGTIRDECIRQRVKETYESIETYPQAVKDLFLNMTLQDRLEQPGFHLVKWLETVELAHRNILDGEHPNIYRHFQPTRPPDHPYNDGETETGDLAIFDA